MAEKQCNQNEGSTAGDTLPPLDLLLDETPIHLNASASSGKAALYK